VWDWLVDSEETAGYLGKLAEAIERGWLEVPSPESIARRARTLATKVRVVHEIHA
jgi:hypothetical protein